MFSLRIYWKYPGICFLTESFDSGRAAEKWILLTRKPAVIVGVAVVSVELWRDWSQVLHQQEDEAQSHHLGFFCCHLERSEAVLITFLCSVSGGKNNPKRQHLSQITSSTATFTCFSVAVSSDLYQSSSTFPSKRAVFFTLHTFTSVSRVDATPFKPRSLLLTSSYRPHTLGCWALGSAGGPNLMSPPCVRRWER